MLKETALHDAVSRSRNGNCLMLFYAVSAVALYLGGNRHRR
jgi:hypothetical protein